MFIELNWTGNMESRLTDRLTGIVKWFNNKRGYGFLVVTTEGEYMEREIFVHFSSILGKLAVVDDSPTYKYLVNNEIVEFNLIKATKEKYEYQAIDVTGLNGGLVMCLAHPRKGGNRRFPPTNPPL